MNKMIFIYICLIIIILFILSLSGFMYFSNISDNVIDDSTSNMVNIILPTLANPPYNNNILILAPKGIETNISKIIIIDKDNNVIMPKNFYNLKPDQLYLLNGTKKSNSSGQYIITFESSIIKSISISGNLKDNLLYLKGNTKDFGVGTVNKLTDSYTQVINYKV